MAQGRLLHLSSFSLFTWEAGVTDLHGVGMSGELASVGMGL